MRKVGRPRKRGNEWVAEFDCKVSIGDEVTIVTQAGKSWDATITNIISTSKLKSWAYAHRVKSDESWLDK